MSQETQCPPHRYKRRNLTKKKDKKAYLVYQCLDCSHYIRVDMIAGKAARCHNCNSPFIVTSKQAARMAKLRCKNCIKYKDETVKMRNHIDSLLDKIINEM